jgi:hypothetical protein
LKHYKIWRNGTSPTRLVKVAVRTPAGTMKVITAIQGGSKRDCV